MNADSSQLVEYPSTLRTSPTRDEQLRVAIRLALVTSVRLLQDGLAHLLRDRDPALCVETIYPDDALETRLLSFAPDVVLIDIVTLRRGVAGRVRDVLPASRTVVFAVDEVEEDLLACAEVGVAGFVGRDASVEELLDAVASAQRGELHCPPRLASLMFHRLTALVGGGTDRLSLTSRQIQIVRLIEAGLSNKEIARQLSIEVSTVKNHVHNVLGKLRVNHRWQAPAVALPTGLTTRLAPPVRAPAVTR
jgi:two-component system, NarL family, nitrate/nitrite response regulator NarL